MSEMQNTLDRINGQLDIAEEKVSELEGPVMEAFPLKSVILLRRVVYLLFSWCILDICRAHVCVFPKNSEDKTLPFGSFHHSYLKALPQVVRTHS